MLPSDFAALSSAWEMLSSDVAPLASLVQPDAVNWFTSLRALLMTFTNYCWET